MTAAHHRTRLSKGLCRSARERSEQRHELTYWNEGGVTEVFIRTRRSRVAKVGARPAYPYNRRCAGLGSASISVASEIGRRTKTPPKRANNVPENGIPGGSHESHTNDVFPGTASSRIRTEMSVFFTNCQIPETKMI
jgi:hypothetical protein